MEKLIILLLVAIGSAISHYYQNKRKREEEEKLGGAPSPRRSHGPPLVPGWPKTGKNWQEELRRVLGGEMVPPPVSPRPPAPPFLTPRTVTRTKVVLPKTEMKPRERSEGEVTFPSPLKQSATAYSRASALPEKIETRLQAIDARTKAHRPSAIKGRSISPNAAALRRWTRDRNSLREAFLASLIFAPPVGLTGPSVSRGG
jgi:hypothetical protein